MSASSTVINRTVVWITGASSGIGVALARKFYKEGAKLILTARSEKRLKVTREKLLSLYGGKSSHISILPFDVSLLNQAGEVTERALGCYGKVNYVVHCAGISNRGSVLDTSLEVFQKVMNVNYFGAVAITKAILPHMVESNEQCGFVVVSSVQGKLGIPNRAPYASSKHALHGFFDSLRPEVHDKGVSVLIACPGYVKTGLSLNALSANGDKHGKMDESTAKGYEPLYVANEIVTAFKAGKQEVVIADIKAKLALALKNWLPNVLLYFLSQRA